MDKCGYSRCVPAGVQTVCVSVDVLTPRGIKLHHRIPDVRSAPMGLIPMDSGLSGGRVYGGNGFFSGGKKKLDRRKKMEPSIRKTIR